MDYDPQYITLYDKNYVLVSVDVDGIQIINLTITSVKDNVWIKNKSNTLIPVDIMGKVLKKIQTTFDPWDISANKDGDIYCTDRDNDMIFVVTLDGKEREIYSSPDLTEPNGVPVECRSDVYVAGYASNNILKIYKNGQKYDIVLTADDGINGPSGLFFNYETRELLVINNYFDSVNIYKVQ